MNIYIINCFDTYEHRVDLIHEILKNSGHNVQVLTSNFRHFEKTKRNDHKDDFIFFNAIEYHKNLSVTRLYSHSKVSKDIFNYLETQTVDLLWILIPPNSFAKDAALYKKNHPNVKLIFDLIDLWPETMPIGSIKRVFPFSIWKNLRDKNLIFADYVVTECDLYQEILNDRICKSKTKTIYLARPNVIYNPHLNLPDDRINLCYLGSINNIIDPEYIVKILEHFIRIKPVELHIIGDGERKDELISLSKGAGASVVFYGKIYNREEKQKILDSCHYGLNVMKDSVCVGLTMKSIDYFEFGLPIINNIHGDTWNLVEKYNLGFNGIPPLDTFYDYSQRQNARCFFEENLTSDIFNQNVLSIISDWSFIQ